VLALPTLRRKTDSLSSFMSCLGQLFQRNQPTHLSEWYHRVAGYRMLADLPTHPIIRTKILELNRAMPYIKTHYEVAGRHSGPIAGDHVEVHGVGCSKIEVSEAACPQMLQHSIGGTPMVSANLGDLMVMVPISNHSKSPECNTTCLFVCSVH
jgi:acyl transferase domain-containing protein